MNLQKLCANIERLRIAQNINLHVDLIAGLPYEGLESFEKSFNDVYALHADQLQLGFLKVLGGTEMHKMAEEYDIRYSGRPPYEVLSTKWLSCKESDLLRRICDVPEYYYNSGQFTHTWHILRGAGRVHLIFIGSSRTSSADADMTGNDRRQPEDMTVLKIL